ncbi:MAG: site-specific integrase, partial [Nocardioidaceae bacterium]
MTRAESGPPEPPPEGLSAGFATLLADYERHLTAERDLTAHTVRAYLADITALLGHAQALGAQQLADVDLRTLRSWLARQQTLGKTRTTIARRATA